MWVFWLNSSCHLGILNTTSVITAKAEHIGHFVMTEGRIGEKSKADGKGGLMGMASFRAPWLFLSKWKKYKCGVSKSAQQVRAAVTRAVPSPRCSAKGEGLGHLLAAWRQGTHTSPCTPGWQQGPGGNRAPECALPQHKEEVPPWVHTPKASTELWPTIPGGFRGWGWLSGCLEPTQLFV